MHRNSAVDDQGNAAITCDRPVELTILVAICRASRRGQTEHVHVLKIVMTGTIDEEVIKTQKRKRDEIDPVLKQDKKMKYVPRSVS